MTSNRRIHRLAAFTAMSVVFAITSTVSALASSGGVSSEAPAASPVTVVAAPAEYAPSETVASRAARAPFVPPAPVVKPVTVVAKVVTRAVPPAPKAKPRATTRPTAPRKPVAAAKVVTSRTITISRYVDAPGSQQAIDACNLVLWSHTPLWLAAHNYCGYQWLATVPTGTTVRVTSGAAAGTFVVTGHLRLDRQGGVMPAVNADLVLQTCVGSGTGLTLLRRV